MRQRLSQAQPHNKILGGLTMEKKIRYIIREVPPEHTEFSFYFDDDGLTAAGGDYCYNLFIVAQSRRSSGFNEEEYQNIQNEIENLLEMSILSTSPITLNIRVLELCCLI
jgi:hypothetical protein